MLGPPTAELSTVVANLPSDAAERFKSEMVPALWPAGVKHGVDPVGLVAQAGKETAWGNYTGQVLPQFYNTCGLKIRHQNLFPGITDADRPLAHAMFPNWKVGAYAHAQHVLRYAGGPEPELIVDPRWYLVQEPFVTTWAELGGRWAPSSTYGQELETIIARLRGT